MINIKISIGLLNLHLSRRAKSQPSKRTVLIRVLGPRAKILLGCGLPLPESGSVVWVESCEPGLSNTEIKGPEWPKGSWQSEEEPEWGH